MIDHKDVADADAVWQDGHAVNWGTSVCNHRARRESWCNLHSAFMSFRLMMKRDRERERKE